MSWEPVIGIEIHVELMTASKMFCGCEVAHGGEPNTRVCPTCLGLPGALPVTNRIAIESIMAIGLAMGCDVSPRSVFHRKNYFYADLPKNYQISQFDVPVCHDGHLDIEVDGSTRRVGIERAHMEEDTGKSIHVGTGGRIHTAERTLLDFNRSGVPLVEVVSRPDMRSAAEARVFAQEVRSVIAELGVSDVRLEEGSIRFDANVSVRPGGSQKFGTKVEIKNMNSFRSLERAIAFEVGRQTSLLESGESVIQETRHWDEESGVTHSMRVKEGSSDYRYFTEPDLVPLVMTPEWVAGVAARLPEMPAERRSRYAAQGLSTATAGILSGLDSSLRAIYDEALLSGAPPPAVANWLTGEVVAWLRRTEAETSAVRLDGASLAELIQMIDEGSLSSSAAKEILDGVMSGEGGPREVAEERDLLQVSDAGALEEVVASVLDDNPGAVDEFLSGEEKVVGYLVGQVMKATQGKADPRLVNQLLRDKMSG
jgi:aspartyl-tRNA(Asn)/glutamyl-tRNA(Gln) amidotransferase subunit B